MSVNLFGSLPVPPADVSAEAVAEAVSKAKEQKQKQNSSSSSSSSASSSSASTASTSTASSSTVVPVELSGPVSKKLDWAKAASTPPKIRLAPVLQPAAAAAAAAAATAAAASGKVSVAPVRIALAPFPTTASPFAGGEATGKAAASTSAASGSSAVDEDGFTVVGKGGSTPASTLSKAQTSSFPLAVNTVAASIARTPAPLASSSSPSYFIPTSMKEGNTGVSTNAAAYASGNSNQGSLNPFQSESDLSSFLPPSPIDASLREGIVSALESATALPGEHIAGVLPNLTAWCASARVGLGPFVSIIGVPRKQGTEGNLGGESLRVNGSLLNYVGGLFSRIAEGGTLSGSPSIDADVQVLADELKRVDVRDILVNGCGALSTVFLTLLTSVPSHMWGEGGRGTASASPSTDPSLVNQLRDFVVEILSPLGDDDAASSLASRVNGDLYAFAVKTAESFASLSRNIYSASLSSSSAIVSTSAAPISAAAEKATEGLITAIQSMWNQVLCSTASLLLSAHSIIEAKRYQSIEDAVIKRSAAAASKSVAAAAAVVDKGSSGAGSTGVSAPLPPAGMGALLERWDAASAAADAGTRALQASLRIQPLMVKREEGRGGFSSMVEAGGETTKVASDLLRSAAISLLGTPSASSLASLGGRSSGASAVPTISSLIRGECANLSVVEASTAAAARSLEKEVEAATAGLRDSHEETTKRLAFLEQERNLLLERLAANAKETAAAAEESSRIKAQLDHLVAPFAARLADVEERKTAASAALSRANAAADLITLSTLVGQDYDISSPPSGSTNSTVAASTMLQQSFLPPAAIIAAGAQYVASLSRVFASEGELVVQLRRRVAINRDICSQMDAETEKYRKLSLFQLAESNAAQKKRITAEFEEDEASIKMLQASAKDRIGEAHMIMQTRISLRAPTSAAAVASTSSPSSSAPLLRVPLLALLPSDISKMWAGIKKVIDSIGGVPQAPLTDVWVCEPFVFNVGPAGGSKTASAVGNGTALSLTPNNREGGSSSSSSSTTTSSSSGSKQQQGNNKTPSQGGSSATSGSSGSGAAHLDAVAATLKAMLSHADPKQTPPR